MLKEKFLTTGILASLIVSPSFAESPCDYNHKVDSQFVKQIDKTENIDRKVFPYIEDTRKCIMTMDIFIDGVSYPGKGEFVFGPDISENMACKNAMQRAKEDVIQSVSPEILNAKTDMSCEQKEVKPIIVSQPKIQPHPVPLKIEPTKSVVTERIIYQEPVITERVIYKEPIVTKRFKHVHERVIYTQPQYHHRNNSTTDLIGTAISILNFMNR